jgi:hypothetical protein
MKEILRQQNQLPLLAMLLRASLPDVSAVFCRRVLVDESGMITTQMGTYNRTQNGRSGW